MLKDFNDKVVLMCVRACVHAHTHRHRERERERERGDLENKGLCLALPKHSEHFLSPDLAFN